MPHKTRPLCAWCAKPMPKATSVVYFGQREASPGGFTERPRTVAEARRFTNHEIVKVMRWPLVDGDSYICQVSTWDGSSYGSSTANWSTKLCSGKCAKEMGMAAAENGMTSKTYAAKMKEQTHD